MSLFVQVVSRILAVAALAAMQRFLAQHELAAGDPARLLVYKLLKLVLQVVLALMTLVVVAGALRIPLAPVASAIVAVAALFGVVMHSQVSDLMQGVLLVLFSPLGVIGNKVQLSLSSCVGCSVQDVTVTVADIMPFVVVARAEDGSIVNVRYASISAVRLVQQR